MWYTVRIALISIIIAWTAISMGIGEKFDEICIEGRISAEQAQVLNELEWKKCPSYRTEGCTAESNDRILVGQCSEFFKFLWHPNKWIKAISTVKLPWQY